ncbi:hypothetical protein D3C74_432360 [compost metagenome]
MLAALGLHLVKEGFHLPVVQFRAQTVRNAVIVYPRFLPEQADQRFQRVNIGIGRERYCALLRIPRAIAGGHGERVAAKIQRVQWN